MHPPFATAPNIPTAPAPAIQTAGLMRMESTVAQSALADAEPTVAALATPVWPVWAKALAVFAALGVLTLILSFTVRRR